MNADVTIKSEEGGQLGTAPNTVYQTNVFDKYGDQADAEIARIIQENAGAAVGAQSSTVAHGEARCIEADVSGAATRGFSTCLSSNVVLIRRSKARNS